MTEETNHSHYIMIVEDSPVDYEITTRSLRKAGIGQTFHHCEDGDEALGFLMNNEDLPRQGYPALILLDLNLPGTDGRQVLLTLKNHDELRKIPVIILTTSNNENDIEVCYKRGANSYIRKPSAPDDYVHMAETLKEYWFDWVTLPDGDD